MEASVDLGGGVNRADLGCLVRLGHGGSHAVHVSGLAGHRGLQLVGIDLGMFPPRALVSTRR